MANPHSLYEAHPNLYCYSLYLTCDECKTQTENISTDHDYGTEGGMYSKPECGCGATARYSDLDELLDGVGPVIIPEYDPGYDETLEEIEEMNEALAEALEEEATNVVEAYRDPFND